jgi:lysophospholipase L1-like esterase
MWFLCTYDSSKTLIEQDSTHPKTYEVGENVAYIRFSYGGTNGLYIDYQLEANDTYTGYEAHTTYNMLVNSLYPSWAGKKWVCVGDSLTEANSRTDKHYYDYVSEKTGIKVINMGVGGTGYFRGYEASNAFYQRISSVPTNADVITIFGSLNDLGSGAELGTADDTGTTTLGGAINTTLDNLFTAYPLANVGVVAPTPWNAEQYDTIHEPNSASAYVALLHEICAKRSIPFLDLFHCSLLRPWDATFRPLAYAKDDGSGTHPSEAGHKLIAPRFKGFLDMLLI